MKPYCKVYVCVCIRVCNVSKSVFIHLFCPFINIDIDIDFIFSGTYFTPFILRNPNITLQKSTKFENIKDFLENSFQGFKTKHHCVPLALEKFIHTNTHKDMLKAFSKASLFCFDMHHT